MQEIAEALVATGRPLRHLHLLRESLDRRGARRGYIRRSWAGRAG
jgi:hypothetical protein